LKCGRFKSSDDLLHQFLLVNFNRRDRESYGMILYALKKRIFVLLVALAHATVGAFLICSSTVSSSFAGGNEEALFISFDEEPVGLIPNCWQVIGGEWRTAISEAEQVFQQSLTTLQGLSYAVYLPANYTVSVQVRPIKTATPSGVGLVAYWQDAQNHYRLMSYNDRVLLVKVSNGQIAVLSKLIYSLEVGKWYCMKLSVMSVGKRILLYGKVWDKDEREPSGWMLMGEDLSPMTTHGWAGLWCAKGVYEFDDFELLLHTRDGKQSVSLRDSFESYEAGQTPSTWTFVGGLWRIREGNSKTLQQLNMLDEYAFKHNCYALILGHHSYTITAKMRATAGGEVYGVGLTLHWRGANSHYDILSVGANRLMVWVYSQEALKPRLIGEKQCTIERWKWHYFKARVKSMGKATQLQVKVWRSEQDEPREWLIETDDDAPQRIFSGTFGFVTLATSVEIKEIKVEFDVER